MGIGPLEIGIVLVILLIVFGPKKLPGLGRGLGSGMREFKEGITGDDKKDAQALTPPAQPPVAPPTAPPAEAQPVQPAEQPAPPRTEE